MSSITEDTEAMAVLRRLKEAGYDMADIRAAYDTIRLPSPPPTNADLEEARRLHRERFKLLLAVPFHYHPRLHRWLAGWHRGWLLHEERKIRRLRQQLGLARISQRPSP